MSNDGFFPEIHGQHRDIDNVPVGAILSSEAAFAPKCPERGDPEVQKRNYNSRDKKDFSGMSKLTQ